MCIIMLHNSNLVEEMVFFKNKRSQILSQCTMRLIFRYIGSEMEDIMFFTFLAF